jgi:hypothetical protein
MAINFQWIDSLATDFKELAVLVEDDSVTESIVQQYFLMADAKVVADALMMGSMQPKPHIPQQPIK